MATKTDSKPAGVAVEKIRSASKTYEGLSREQLVEAYRIMYTSRRVDDREILLKRQQKIFFQISGAGHEAVGVAAGLAMKPGYDWFYPYYRDRALCLALGATPLDMLLMAVGAASDGQSGGRQMPSHWSFPKFNVVTQSSPTGSQILQAVGCAEGGRYFASHPQAAKKSEGDYRQFKDVKFERDEVTYVSLGDGATSEGEFWEAMNTASNGKLPILFVIEDNAYAISVPVEVQTAGGNISRLGSNFPNMPGEERDGTGPLESYAVFSRAIAHCRERRGPALVHFHVTRPYSHSLSDDEKLYKTESEREEEAQRDPLPKFALFLIREGILDERGIEKIEAGVDREVAEATDSALAAELPGTDSIYVSVYSPDVDPTSKAFEAEPQFSGAPKTM